MKHVKVLILVGMAALLAIGLYWWWHHNTIYPSTDDAYWLTGIAALAMLPVVLILQRPKMIAAHATS